jgi:predicted ABC-type ATPase
LKIKKPRFVGCHISRQFSGLVSLVIFWVALTLSLPVWGDFSREEDSLSRNSGGSKYTGYAAQVRGDFDIESFGIPSLERQQLLDEMIEDCLSGEDGSAEIGGTQRPTIYVLMGTPGSGKSTIHQVLVSSGFIPNSLRTVIAADQFKPKFREYQELLISNPAKAALYVHRESLLAADIASYLAIQRGISFTLDGSASYLQSQRELIRAARSSGRNYRLVLVRIRTSVDSALKREELRFQDSQRRVPEKDILDKAESIKTVFAETADDFDEVITVSNERYPRIISAIRDGRYVSFVDQVGPDNSIDYTTRRAHRRDPIDVIIDIDWTLAYLLPSSGHSTLDAGTFRFSNTFFRFSDYAAQVIFRLARDSRFRVSFFSGGSTNRIEHMLRQLEISPGLSAFDIAFQILTKHNLTNVSTDSSLPFSVRFKKDLGSVMTNINLERAILIDDIKDFGPDGQRRNMLWIDHAMGYFKDLGQIRQARVEGVDSRYVPREINGDGGLLDWQRERQKLLYSLGVILEAARLSESQGRTPVQMLNELTRDKNGNFISREVPRQNRFYEIGRLAISEGDSSVRREKAVLPFEHPRRRSDQNNCRRLVLVGGS